MHGPNPDALYPLAGFPRVVFLKNFITKPNIEVGNFSYYDDPDGAERFEERNVLHHFDFYGDRLVIGRFVAIGSGTRFVMNGANHAMGGFSTYPFNIFGEGWEKGFDMASWTGQSRGDTKIEDDVWFGMDCTVMPGVTIGAGAIVATNSTLVSNVPAYAVVGGNPARVIRMRYNEETIARLLAIAWWTWSAEEISSNLDLIRGDDLDALEQVAKQRKSMA
ncbi:streptogramin A acetyl transferase [Fulvimarina pelagi HTCC2506]|uniref:Streptogramin A acetyl transferase n=1 Tax=Fulvimarina pelagi HTCC2506 TaxID=314231 RepID=Q0G0U1_9HYPH|nr:CatB-related O-acetyltransferase [Fulvimarina pelagi]EAU40898.1 streptogramin A acetyl transferase [Fulvimarina pelagi HTCC2506]